MSIIRKNISSVILYIKYIVDLYMFYMYLDLCDGYNVVYSRKTDLTEIGFFFEIRLIRAQLSGVHVVNGLFESGGNAFETRRCCCTNFSLRPLSGASWSGLSLSLRGRPSPKALLSTSQTKVSKHCAGNLLLRLRCCLPSSHRLLSMHNAEQINDDSQRTKWHRN